MSTTLEAANDAMRAAVRTRLEATPKDDPKMRDYVSQPATEPRHIDASTEDSQHESETYAEWDRMRGDGLLSEICAKQNAVGRHGTTAKFGTGAVRSDAVEAFRYDLVSPIGLREVARACAEGASKYSDFNWEKGMPVHDLLNHAIAHVYAFLSGDRSEPHLGHAAWNLMAAIHSHELWPHLNEGHLRADGCRSPRCDN
jgi:hypothetical protein